MNQLWMDYIYGKQSLGQLARKNERSIDWVRRKLNQVEMPKRNLEAREIVLVVDTTFWGTDYGVIVFRDPHQKENVYYAEIQRENKTAYLEGRSSLEDAGFKIKAVVMDGKACIHSAFGDCLVQMCHFHQLQIVTKYLTKKPKLAANRELRFIALSLKNTNERVFTEELDMWHERWSEFLKEKTVNWVTGTWFYTHKKTRAAYRSLRKHLPVLFTYQRQPELCIPNTTNSLDGSFSHLKTQLRIHSGLSNEKRWMCIQEVLCPKKHPF